MVRQSDRRDRPDDFVPRAQIRSGDCTPGTGTRSLERRTDHFHLVLLHEGPIRLCVYALSICKALLEPSRGHTDQYHPGLDADALKCVGRSFRYEHEGVGRGARDAVANLQLELTLDDVEEFVLATMNVKGRPALRCDGLAKHAEGPSGLLAGREQFGNIAFS